MKTGREMQSTSLEKEDVSTAATSKLLSEPSGLPTLEKGDAAAETENNEPGERTVDDDMEEHDRRCESNTSSATV